MDYRSFIASPPSLTPLGGFALIVAIVWTLVWKGLALWRAAKRGENVWFVLLLILNTLGILEIIYYFLIAKRENKR